MSSAGANQKSPRRSRRLLLYCSPVVFPLALAVYGMAEMGRIQARAELLAASGQGVGRLLKTYAQAVKSQDLKSYEACFHESRSIAPLTWEAKEISNRDGVEAYTWTPTKTALDESGAPLQETLETLWQDIDHFTAARFKLQTLENLAASGPDLQSSATTATARARLWLRGVDVHGSTFESWIGFRLTLQQQSGAWKIESQELLDGITVKGNRDGFIDVAQRAGLTFRARHNPLFETPEWQPSTFGIIRYGSAGVSAADVDGDGWDDLFFADGESPRLYRNLGARGDGPAPHFVDITTVAGLPDSLPGVNVALFVDLDNDGDQDLFLGRFMDGNRLYRNDGPDPLGRAPVRFTDLSSETDLGAPFVVTASAADHDLDGDLDLYLGRYLDPRSDLPTTLFYTRNGQGNSLLRNDGDLHFTDITEEAGVREGGLTLGVAWGDVDDDGDPDLYIANDFGRNALLRNEGPGQQFTDWSEASGTLDFGFGMSAAFGDIDNDGGLDLYVSNVHSGQRWYSQATTLSSYLLTSLRQGTIRQDFGLYREIFGYTGSDWHLYGDRMVKGNSLLLNDGQGHFEDIAETTGANPFGWYWSSAFLDYDNDGWLDLYAANGWISGRSDDDL